MSQQGHILIVDDTRDGRLLVSMMLEDDYELNEADSGEACLAAIEEKIPDLVLLDVEMPGMNGYEVCTCLRQRQETRYLPVIFVSALDSPEERLAGFEAGGNDYVIKPVDEDELLEKISTCLQRQQSISQTEQQASDATKMAMEALTVSGELGQIINFVKEVQQLETPVSVGQAVLDIAQQFRLNSAVMVANDNKHYVGCQPDSLEASLLAQVANSKERILSVGIRTVVRNDHIALLIKDMPLDDENRYGRIKDHLAVLMDIANGHLITLEAREEVLKQRKAFLNEIISVAEEQILKTTDRINEHQKDSQKIMQDMLSELESMLFSLGLDDDQENKLMKLADQASLKLQEASDSTRDMGAELGVILEKLYEFLHK